jgi:aldehyde:ferredoxin oxidoreductase
MAQSQQNVGAGPEYEHLFGFGSNCGIDDLKTIARAAYTCRESGIDAVSAAAVVAEMLELAEIGALRDIGQGLKFGDADSLTRLVTQMDAGEGLAEILCQGPQGVAEQFGHPEVFVGVKGQPLATCDLRGDDVMALCTATSSTRLVHLPGGLLSPVEQSDDAVVKKSIELQDFGAAIDSAGLCPLVAAVFPPSIVAELLSATTGIEYSPERLLNAGSAVWRAEKSFDTGAGTADGLPSRLLEPLREGPAAGHVPRTGELLPAYYRARKWEVKFNGANN